MALEIKDKTIFEKVISDAVEKAISTCTTEVLAKRWANAIDRAVREIEGNPYLDFDASTSELLILSPSNNIYSANGVCQCLAFLNGTPCWHRAAARIWRLYLEAANKSLILPPSKAAAAAAAKYPEQFLPVTSSKRPEKIGSVRI